MPVKRIRGINIVYDDTGSGDPIVFVHGHPFNRSMWKYQAGWLAKGPYRMIAPDLRGYGETGIAGERVLLDEMALDIAYLLEELDIDKAVLCGLSMGGQVVLDLYRLFPHMVKGMVIADSDARGETPESYKKRLLLADILIKDGMKKYTDENIHQYIAAASNNKDAAMYQHLYAMMTTTAAAGAAAAGAAAAHRGRAERRDHLSILSAIDVPVLIVVGAEDHFTPLPVAEIMYNNIPGAQLVCIEGTGHLPNMEAPEKFNEVLASFLKRNDL